MSVCQGILSVREDEGRTQYLHMSLCSWEERKDTTGSLWGNIVSRPLCLAGHLCYKSIYSSSPEAKLSLPKAHLIIRVIYYQVRAQKHLRDHKKWLCCYFRWIFRFISGLSAAELLKGASVSPSAFRWNAPLYLSVLIVINVEDLVLLIVPHAKLRLHISWLIYLLCLSLCFSLLSCLISKCFSLWGQLPGWIR